MIQPIYGCRRAQRWSRSRRYRPRFLPGCRAEEWPAKKKKKRAGKKGAMSESPLFSQVTKVIRIYILQSIYIYICTKLPLIKKEIKRERKWKRKRKNTDSLRPKHDRESVSCTESQAGEHKKRGLVLFQWARVIHNSWQNRENARGAYPKYLPRGGLPGPSVNCRMAPISEWGSKCWAKGSRFLLCSLQEYSESFLFHAGEM